MCSGPHTINRQHEPSRKTAGLAGRHRLRLASGKALSPIGRNRSVDDGATVNAFPRVENEKEI
jgi:hypothetical protein